MDRDLLNMLEPFTTPKVDYSVQPPAPMQTQVFWDEPVFTPASGQRDRLGRTARVMVYSLEEQSEL